MRQIEAEGKLPQPPLPDFFDRRVDFQRRSHLARATVRLQKHPNDLLL
jgi:hypothetical protein